LRARLRLCALQHRSILDASVNAARSRSGKILPGENTLKALLQVQELKQGPTG